MSYDGHLLFDCIFRGTQAQYLVNSGLEMQGRTAGMGGYPTMRHRNSLLGQSTSGFPSNSGGWISTGIAVES